ncbi:type 2 isopentenyl-diphosphate Delta-isomerase [Methanococcus maripaludis]|uniref:Isopentenyl-diphosphate delta-isomerase n=5 Tax=Methanococcus maripaludis TaxID=39152 RepID=IDI2_METMP|nr:type 2 isopentenyl-diphosphate Delta-isomerase [Methanococcus maripaludis]Q6M174.1 RecName: Full=Isopentenyl-diphosphate delta-isomerase; Short=IPP isomerase; AltName: Full=Isopentenyl diphosphate:dimethylallyl diphosphate isomerase; AltName: Full=Isopentenyl pyrophosphate isomerase; AltName: Full=Type 2 isopentenyl diphosphate isomerase; Short=IDI-2 [Methanococcus maripaludis S2]MDK2928664.1 isopentenyl-diphosphate Delta-isomerase [Methanococcus sp.]AEK18936.1 isopentenyl pyrophosphate isome
MNNNSIEYRKLEHLIVCDHCDVEYKKGTLLEDVELIHSGISNCDLDDIDTSIEIFGKKLNAPLIVAAITGGHPKAKEVNKNIAIAVEELNLGMGVGSQRAAISKSYLEDTYSVVRDHTSSLIIGNLGAVNFVEDSWDEEIISKSVEMIDADAMAIHFNPLQEAIQPEGDVNFKGLNILKEIISNYNKIHGKIPFIAKQVGEGFSKKDAIFLKEIGFDAIDVGGSGGTSWAAVELYRIKDEEQKNFSNQYFNWGIPTAASILEVNSAFSGPIIATGGIRTGIDIAKSISIGANCCGTALPILKAALKSSEAVTTVLERMIKELKTTMFLTGCNNINELKSARYILKGDLKNWKDQI